MSSQNIPIQHHKYVEFFAETELGGNFPAVSKFGLVNRGGQLYVEMLGEDARELQPIEDPHELARLFGSTVFPTLEAYRKQAGWPLNDVLMAIGIE